MMKAILSKVLKAVYFKAVKHGLIRRKTFSVNNKKVVLTDLNKSNLLLQLASKGFDSYENETVTLIKKYPWQMDNFLDLGANVGFYSILVENSFPAITKVIAVEPFPKNIAYIKKIKRINSLKFELIDKALDGKSNEKITLYYPTAKTSSKLSLSASLINSFQGTNGIYDHLPYKTAETQTITLPALTENLGGSTLIKLDCEGKNLDILKASVSVLEKDNIDFIIEIMINDEDKLELYNFVKDYGYDSYLITNSGLISENRPLTLPYPHRKNRTIWKNHFFTKRSRQEVKEASLIIFGYWI